MGEIAALEGVYGGIGDFFKAKCIGYRGYVFAGNLPLLKKMGLGTSRRLVFHNADIECRLAEYELYAGRRKPGFRRRRENRLAVLVREGVIPSVWCVYAHSPGSTVSSTVTFVVETERMSSSPPATG